MKGVAFAAVGAEPKVVDDLEVPTPGPGQVLVKSLWTAINPVYVYLSSKSYENSIEAALIFCCEDVPYRRKHSLPH